MKEFFTVYVAELMRRLRSKPFLIGLAIGTLGVLFIVKAPAFLGNAITGSKTAVLIGDPELTDRAASLLADDFTIAGRFAPEPVTPQVFAENDASIALVLGARGKHLTLKVYARDPASVPTSILKERLLPLQVQVMSGGSWAQVKSMLDIPIEVHPVASKFTSAGQAQAAHAIAYVLIFFLYLLILLNSQLVMSSVAEEKTTRIAELLIASVNPVILLAGKIAAAATLALLQLFIWVGIAAFAGPSASGAQSAGIPINGADSFAGSGITLGIVLAFVAFFILGLLQVSTLFAGLASLVNRTEDLGSLQGPFVIPVVGALFIAMSALSAPDSWLSLAASEIPILSPFVMFARMAVSEVPAWQVALALFVNLAALGTIAIVAGKLYRVGMLLYGRPPKISQIWNVLRT